MTMTVVSRRVVGFAKTKRKVVPQLPPKQASDELVGEPARPFAMLARRAVPDSPKKNGWQRLWKPAAILIVAVACFGLAYYSITSSRSPLAEYSASNERPSHASSRHSGSGMSMREGARSSGSSQVSERQVPVVLSERTLPTDDSFRATAYVRRKLSFPNISGVCVVKGSGSRDIGDCLRRQE